MTENVKKILHKALRFTESIESTVISPYHILYSFMEDSVVYFPFEKKQDVSERYSDVLDLVQERAVNSYEKQYTNNYLAFSEKSLCMLKNVSNISQLYTNLLVDGDISELLGEAGIMQLDLGEKQTGILERVCMNLTAESADLSPVIGREKEMHLLMEILTRKLKSNPVLIGKPGVGKTAVVEGLAKRIASKDVPSFLADKIIYNLRLNDFVAHFSTNLEQGVLILEAEIKSRDDVILFIDELHMLKSDKYALIADMLKPMLARGDLHCIGATTQDEYKKIEADGALERRFQPVYVEEPDLNYTYRILSGVKEYYEDYHNILYTPETLYVAAKYSQRYISGRNEPDKAIDLIDEAASNLRISNNYKPDVIEELEGMVANLEIKKEVSSLKMKSGKGSEKQISAISEKLEETKKIFADSTEIWQKEKSLIDKYLQAKELYVIAKQNIAIKQNSNVILQDEDYDTLLKLCVNLEAVKQDLRRPSIKFCSLVVKPHHIMTIIAKLTDIPVDQLKDDEIQKVLNLDKALHKSVIGQNEAIMAIKDALMRFRAGIHRRGTPIGSFIFLGPTGVGKTYLAKCLAKEVFGDESNIVRFDMSEYMERFNITKLIGSPPGYVGYDNGGQLTEAIKRRPYSVILFDEIEKAHPDIYNILLQILDDGRLTDSYGNTINFENTIIILTSNLGSQQILRYHGQAHKYNVMKNEVLSMLPKHFRPELLNRIGEKIVFHSLTREEIKEIVILQVNELVSRLEEVSNVTIEIKTKAIEYLAYKGYDPEYGARPLANLIRSDIETKISDVILNNKKGNLVIDSDGKGITFR